MARRVEELRALRDGLAEGDPASHDAARAVGQALRGSGATFGFPELTAVAGLVETAANGEITRKVEGLIEHLLGVSGPQGEESAVRFEWLLLAAGLSLRESRIFSDPAGAWTFASERAGLTSTHLAERATGWLGLETAGPLHPSPAVLRLVPEALMRRAFLLPIVEDTAKITVATSDPTCLRTELELTRLTGRVPVFVVAAPDVLSSALDALASHGPAESPPVARRALASSEADAGTVLVVDDDGSSRLFARAVLEKRGYSVQEAGDGVEALDRLRGAQPVALVVADLNMPRMDGLELLWEMRESAELSRIPVIVLTGEADEILETKLIEEGADDYLSKPLDPRMFLARVEATLRRAES